MTDTWGPRSPWRWDLRNQESGPSVSGKDLEMVFSMMVTLGGGNSNIFGIFIPKFGEDEPILTNIFFKGVETTN